MAKVTIHEVKAVDPKPVTVKINGKNITLKQGQTLVIGKK